MYHFLLSMWSEKKIDREGLQLQLSLQRITEEEYESIIKTKQRN